MFISKEAVIINNPTAQNIPCTPPCAEQGNELTKKTSYMIAGRKFNIQPVFKSREETPETVGSILLKLMLEKA